MGSFGGVSHLNDNLVFKSWIVFNSPIARGLIEDWATDVKVLNHLIKDWCVDLNLVFDVGILGLRDE